MSYGSIYSFMGKKEMSEKSIFIQHCKRRNIEWIEVETKQEGVYIPKTLLTKLLDYAIESLNELHDCHITEQKELQIDAINKDIVLVKRLMSECNEK
jgi:hypothetical protein